MDTERVEFVGKNNKIERGFSHKGKREVLRVSMTVGRVRTCSVSFPWLIRASEKIKSETLFSERIDILCRTG